MHRGRRIGSPRRLRRIRSADHKSLNDFDTTYTDHDNWGSTYNSS